MDATTTPQAPPWHVIEKEFPSTAFSIKAGFHDYFVDDLLGAMGDPATHKYGYRLAERLPLEWEHFWRSEWQRMQAP